VKHRISAVLLGTIPFVLLLSLWQIFSHFHLVPHWLIPPPYDVFSVLAKLFYNGTWLKLIGVSFLNIFPPFVFAILGAFLCGVSMGLNKTIHKILNPFIAAVYPIPSLAWLPIIVLFWGFTREGIWLTIFISAFFRMIYSVVTGVKSVDYHLILAAKNLGISKFGIIYKVILPAAMPHLIVGMRVSFGSAWRSLIGAEMLSLTLDGLGKFIWSAQWNFDYEKVIAGIIVISLVGFLVDRIIFRYIESRTLERWGVLEHNKIQ